MVMEGEAMKITGQGRVDLQSTIADIILLVAPLLRLGRVNVGSLILIPLKVEGPIKDLNVVPMSPEAVGRGVLNVMERMLKAPYKMVEGSADWVSIESENKDPAESEQIQRDP